MKLWLKISLIFGGVFIYLGFFLIVPVIIMDKSWWRFFGPLIFFVVVGLVVGIIILAIKWKKKPPITQKINLRRTKDRVIHETKYDEDNPDNFRIDSFEITKEGSAKSEKTPVVTFYGVGTELNQKRVAIVNLNNPKHEITMLIDPNEEKIKESRNKIADNPEEEIKEETTIGMDSFGRPLTTTKTTRPSSAERKQEEEKQKAEEVSAI